MTEAGIVTEQVSVCLLCGSDGKPLYERLSDRLFDAPGEWGHLRCRHCGLVWLNPRPLPMDLGKVYRTYYTHGRKRRFSSIREKAKRGLYSTVPGYGHVVSGWIWKQLGGALSWLPSWRERAVLGTMCLNGAGKGKLLDVGCGDGAFLSIMQDAGWEVRGIEPDPFAAKVAKEARGVPVIAGTLGDAKLTDESVDVVTLSHVIEHAHDPILLLRECRRILKPNGKVIVVTPNLASQGHQVFGNSWVHLDPPRHLYLFSPATLRSCCERAGVSIEMLRTSARNAGWVWAASKTIRRKGSFRREADFTWKLRCEGLRFQMREEASRRTQAWEEAGEELVLIAGPGKSASRTEEVV